MLMTRGLDEEEILRVVGKPRVNWETKIDLALVLRREDLNY